MDSIEIYPIGTSVHIITSEDNLIKGEIVSVNIASSIYYEVEFWVNTEKKSVFVREKEIQTDAKKKKIGFK